MMLLINPMATLLRRELSGRKPGMMTLVSLGIVDAFASSPFDYGLSWI